MGSWGHGPRYLQCGAARTETAAASAGGSNYCPATDSANGSVIDGDSKTVSATFRLLSQLRRLILAEEAPPPTLSPRAGKGRDPRSRRVRGSGRTSLCRYPTCRTPGCTPASSLRRRYLPPRGRRYGCYWNWQPPSARSRQDAGSLTAQSLLPAH